MNLDQGREIIEELDRESKQKEAVFFQRIADRLGRPPIQSPPVREVKGAPGFWENYQLEESERMDLFMKNWESLGGIAKKFSTTEALLSFIMQEATTMQARRIIRWQHPFLEKMGIDEKLPDVEKTVWADHNNENLIIKTASADIGLVVADYAIAHTGTVVVTSGATKGRSVSLLPTALMVIIRMKDIKTRMGEVLAEIRGWNQPMPAGIHFITGPSRSADIENDLTIGVHGPGIVYALILLE